MKTLKLLQKQLLLIMVLLTGGLGFSYAATPFITVWNTANTRSGLAGTGGAPLSGANQVRVPVFATAAGVKFSGSYKKVGENESTRVFFTDYAVPVEGAISNGTQIDFGATGIYELVISSVSGGSALFQFSGGANPCRGDRNRLVNVTQWGDVITFDQPGTFRACAQLDITASDTPVLSGSMASMFQGCTSMVGTSAISNWNVQNVTSFQNFFLNVKLNQSLGSWNLKNATDLTGIIQNTLMDCANFSLTLRGWADNSETPTGAYTLGSLPTTIKYYNDQAAYDAIFTTKGWTYTNKGIADDPLSFSATCTAPLPVTFAGLTASISNKQLLVKWKTVSEQNNDKFIVYISNNGKDWKETGTVYTKAENGNSNQILDYEYTVSTNNLQLASISLIAALISVCLLFSRRKRLIGAVALFTSMFFASCTKNELALQDYIKNGIYVKVTQIDKDGKTSSDSDVVFAK